MKSSKSLRLILLGLCAAAFLAVMPSTASARGPLYRTTYPSKVTYKLWSGVSNVFFCWCEVPIEMNREIQNTDPFTGFWVGLGRGILFTGRRLGLGVVDVVTCPFDLYGNNWQSVQRTEFPFIDEVE